MNHLGKQVECILAQRKITNKEFAKQLDVTVQQLYTILRGKSRSTVRILLKMSEILNVPSDVLLQDYGKEFLIFAIDDYLNQLDKNKAREAIENIKLLINEGKDNG